MAPDNKKKQRARLLADYRDLLPYKVAASATHAAPAPAATAAACMKMIVDKSHFPFKRTNERTQREVIPSALCTYSTLFLQDKNLCHTATKYFKSHYT